MQTIHSTWQNKEKYVLLCFVNRCMETVSTNSTVLVICKQSIWRHNAKNCFCETFCWNDLQQLNGLVAIDNLCSNRFDDVTIDEFFLSDVFKLCDDKLPDCLNGIINGFIHYLLIHSLIREFKNLKPLIGVTVL